MADNYLENKMDELNNGKKIVVKRSNPSLDSLLIKNRSYRGYRKDHVVTEDILKKIVEVNTKIASGMNRQALRFKLVTKDKGAEIVLANVKMGAALPELHLPFPGTEPQAFIIVCSTVPEDRIIDIDLGISLQSMSLKAVEMGLNCLIICNINKAEIQKGFSLESAPLAILAVGKGSESIFLKPVDKGESLKYYRKDKVQFVPKLKIDDLLLP